MALGTIASEHQNFQQVSIHLPFFLGCFSPRVIELHFEEECTRRKWSDLDRLLVQLWESHAVRVEVKYPPPYRGNMPSRVKNWAEYLLPELVMRANVSLVEVHNEFQQSYYAS